MFKLSFPQPEMLQPDDLAAVLAAMKRPSTSRVEMRAISESIREHMNPHPAGQKEENVPQLDGVPVPGLQHKYRETVLFFPSEVCPNSPNTSRHIQRSDGDFRANTVTHFALIVSDGRSFRPSALAKLSRHQTGT